MWHPCLRLFRQFVPFETPAILGASYFSSPVLRGSATKPSSQPTQRGGHHVRTPQYVATIQAEDTDIEPAQNR